MLSFASGYKMYAGAVLLILTGIAGLLTTIAVTGNTLLAGESVDWPTTLTAFHVALGTVSAGVIAFGKAHKDSKLLKATEDNTAEVHSAGEATVKAMEGKA